MKRHEHISKVINKITNKDSLVHFSKVRIPRKVWKKAGIYASLISEIAGFDCECSGYLLADIDDFSGVPTDISYARGYEVGQFFVNSSLESKLNPDTGKQQKTVGVWHSHPGTSTVPSGDDWTWLGGIFRCYAKHNNKLGLKIDYIPTSAKLQMNEGHIELVENDYLGTAVRFPQEYDSNNLDSVLDNINKQGLTKREVKGPGYFISLIVNKYSHMVDHPITGSDYHCMLALEDLGSKDGRFINEGIRETYEVELIDPEVSIKIDRLDMIDEILDYTYFDGQLFRNIADPGNVEKLKTKHYLK